MCDTDFIRKLRNLSTNSNITIGDYSSLFETNNSGVMKEMDFQKGKVKLNNNNITNTVVESVTTSSEDDSIEKGAFFIKNPTMLDDNQKKLYKFISNNFSSPADVLQVVFVWIKELSNDPDNKDIWKGFYKELGIQLVKILTKYRFIVSGK